MQENPDTVQSSSTEASKLKDAWNAMTGMPNGMPIGQWGNALAKGNALEATKTFLEQIDVKAIDTLRKSFELPPESLGTLIEIYSKKLADASPQPTRAQREVLPFSTNVPIRPGQTAQITARPQRVAFRPERFYVSNASPEYKGPWWKRLSPWYKAPLCNGAADWIINDIQIGNRSQFAQAGDVPGDMFSTNAIDSFVSFETAQTAMDIKLVVTYIGPARTGACFYGSMIGTSVHP